MNGIMRTTAAALIAASGLMATGCLGQCGSRCGGVARGDGIQPGERLKNAYDTCWPERYSHAARASALAPFQVQASNGEIMDYTVWNFHFEPGTDNLVPAGLEKLDYLLRRRPAPPATLYMQTSRDLAYDNEKAETYADRRRDLDERRVQAIHNYLKVQTAARPANFEVQIIDASNPGFGAQYPVNAIRMLPFQYQSSLGGMMGGGGQGGQGQGQGQGAGMNAGGGQGGGGQGGGR